MARLPDPSPAVASSARRPRRRRPGIRAASLPAGPARPRAHQGERVPAPAAGEAEGTLHLRRHGKQFRRYYQEAVNRPGKTGENLLQILESRLETSCTAPASPVPARQRVSWSRTVNLLVNNKKVDIPSYRVSQYDIIDVREKSLATLPFQLLVRPRAIADPRVAAGRRWTPPHPGAPAPRACADRGSAAGTADRRVLLEVRRDTRERSVTAAPGPKPFPSWASYSGRSTGGNPMLISQRPTLTEESHR